MNFVLERVGYPTQYLGLSYRKVYPDAIKPSNDGDLEPIFRILYSIYIDQHREVVDQVRQKIGTGSLKLTGGDLAKEFLRLKKKWK